MITPIKGVEEDKMWVVQVCDETGIKCIPHIISFWIEDNSVGYIQELPSKCMNHDLSWLEKGAVVSYCPEKEYYKNKNIDDMNFLEVFKYE